MRYLLKEFTKIFLIILALSSPVWATSYYVETDGNDSCDGLSDVADTTADDRAEARCNSDFVGSVDNFSVKRID